MKYWDEKTKTLVDKPTKTEKTDKTVESKEKPKE